MFNAVNRDTNATDSVEVPEMRSGLRTPLVHATPSLSR